MSSVVGKLLSFVTISDVERFAAAREDWDAFVRSSTSSRAGSHAAQAFERQPR